MTGVGKITDRIAADAAKEAQATLGAAEVECRKLAEEYGNRTIGERDRVAERAQAEGQRMIERAKSTADMNHRAVLLAAKSALIDEVYEKARAKILDTDFGKYRELLTALLVSALLELAQSEEASAALGDETEPYDRIEVLFNHDDREKYGAAVVTEVRRRNERRIGTARLEKLCLSENTAAIDGGLVIRYGNIETNCSLSVLLAEMRRETEGKVASILFPEE